MNPDLERELRCRIVELKAFPKLVQEMRREQGKKGKPTNLEIKVDNKLKELI